MKSLGIDPPEPDAITVPPAAQLPLVETIFDSAPKVGELQVAVDDSEDPVPVVRMMATEDIL
jgi:hypothetical protein